MKEPGSCSTRAEHDTVDHREDTYVQAEAKRERQHCRYGKAWLASDRTKCVTKILSHKTEDVHSPRILQPTP